MSKFSYMGRRAAQALAGLALAGLLAACGGGGGDAGTSVIAPPGSGTTPAALADLSLTLDKTSVTNTGTDVVTVTVTSIDASRAAVGSAPIKFAVDNAAVVTPDGTTTDAKTGQLKATVQIGADHTNRTITITTVSGSITKKISFDVVDSVTGGKVADLAMTLDRVSIPNTGTQNVAVTVTSLDATRSAVGGSPVAFKITDLGTAGDAFVSTGGQTTTNATSGQITATVSLGANHTNRTITLTATSGTVERKITFDVVDPLVSVPKASDLSVVLDKTSIGNSGSESVNVTVTAVDALRNTISGIPITFSVDSNATIATSGNQTNAQGQVTGSVQIGSDRSERLITVTVRSDTLVRTAIFRVSGVNLVGTALPIQPIASSTGNKVDYRLSDVNSNAMSDVAITVSGAGIAGATGKTDINGAYTFVYTAPASPGALDITATAGGKSVITTVTVPSGVSTVPPVTTAVVSASVSASPNVVRVNTAGTSNRSEIRALFLAANNVPLRNVRVRFDLNGDASNVGGTLGAGASIVYSDVSGAAITNYSPDTRSSPTNGVAIRACWDYTDFAANTCPNQVLTSLTVVSDPLSITIGTDDTLADGDTGLTYVKRYVLLVVDAAGNPKSDVQITPSLDLTTYIKGYYKYIVAKTAWIQHYRLDAIGTEVDLEATPGAVMPVCANEDGNRNGAIDGAEDLNGNKQLDPRKSDASISMVGGTKTDANGTAVLKLEYPKSVAGWVQFKIQAAAAGVLSPPAIYTGRLPVSATAIKSETPPPAFVTSPYGQYSFSNGTTCTNPQ